MGKNMKQKMTACLAGLLCVIMCVTGIMEFNPITAKAAAGSIHVYEETPGDVLSSKYTLTANGTNVPVIKYQANGNNFDIARFSSDDASPEYTVNVPEEEIQTVKVYPERYYPQDGIHVSTDKHSVTFTMSAQLRYCFVMINGGPADQLGKPYLAIINDPPEKGQPDPKAANVLNFKTFLEDYLQKHPNADAEKAVPEGTTSGGVAYGQGKLVENSTSQVRFPDKRKMLPDDATYALQAALDEIYKEGSPYDTLYFPAGTYTYSGLEIRNRKGKPVTIYVEEGALLKNRIQECMQAMEPAIGIWDSSDITISGRGIFDGNGVENYKKDRHDAKDSCHQGGVMIVRSSNITFNDTYVRDAKQWNWESHNSKGCTLNNVKGLSPYNQPWVDGLNMASAQDLTINGAITLGNDDNFASGHYNPSDGFTNTVPGYDQYNSDCLSWDTEKSFNVSVNNTLGWSYYAGNGVRMGSNKYGRERGTFTFKNVNTTNFAGGGCGITIQNHMIEVNGSYPRYESIVFENCSFDTTRAGVNFRFWGNDPMFDTVTLDSCWFSNGESASEAREIKKLTIKDLYLDGKKVEVSNFANLTTQNIENFTYDWKDNHAPEFTAPIKTSYEAKVDEQIAFDVAAKDADNDKVTLSAEGLPNGAVFDAESGKFTWTPSESQLGEQEVTFTAEDSQTVKATRKVTFIIKDKVGNTAPVFAEFEGAPYTVKAGETLKFTVSASDPDGDAVALSAVGALPRGAEFHAESGGFTWKTSASQTGVREIVFEAADKWGAVSQASVSINVETGDYNVIDVAAAEDTYMAAWKDEKNKNYEGNEYLRVLRMKGADSNSDAYGLWGEKINSLSDANDAKISVLKFDAAQLKENLDQLEKAELELTLINRRNSTSVGKDRLMAAVVTDIWSASDVTWNTHPSWDTEAIKYSGEFPVDTNPEVRNNVSITASSYDGTKVIIDVTDFVKNMKDSETTLALAICDEKGYELAFASAEGAAKLEDSKNAAPVLHLTVKKPAGPEVEIGKITVWEDAFAGSYSSDQSKNYGNLNFLRASYSKDSSGLLGTGGGSDNKVTYLKFDLSSLQVDEFDRAKLQLTLLGVRKADAVNQEAELLVGAADDTEWTEGGLNWKNKPQVVTSGSALIVSEKFKIGDVVQNDPSKITIPDGTVIAMDVTELVLQARAEGKEVLTFVVNIDDSNSVMTEKDANRIFFVSKEGSGKYPNAADMAPALVLTKIGNEQPEEPVISKIEVKEPDKTEYQTGEELVLDGMKVTAHYSNGTSKDVTAEVLADAENAVKGFDSSKAGTIKVTVTYEGKSADFEVTIKEGSEQPENPEISKIEVKEPDKTEYQTGEELVLDGMKVTAHYSNGTSKDVTAEVMADAENAVKGFDSSKAGTIKVTVTYEGKSADFEVTIKEGSEQPENPEISKIEVKEPDKTEYQTGEELVLDGMKVTAYYSDGSSKDVTAEVLADAENAVKGFDSSKAGTIKVTVTYEGKSADFEVTIKEGSEQPENPEISKIEVKEPDKTEYQTGEELVLNGMEVTAHYSNGTSKDVTAEVIADAENAVKGFDSTKAGTIKVTVTYEGKSADFEVTIKEAAPILTGISLTEPAKKEYKTGEALDLTGMKVVAVYKDGTKKDVTNEAKASGFDSSKTGEQTITVSYGGFSQTFVIKIKRRSSDSWVTPDNGTDNKPDDKPDNIPDNKPDKPGNVTIDVTKTEKTEISTKAIEATEVEGSFYDKEGRKITEAVVTTKDGERYILDEKGRKYVSAIVTVKTGAKYIVDENGGVITGSFVKTSDGTKYYVTKNTGKIVAGKLFKVDNKRYYADKNGKLVVSKWVKIKNKKYYFNSKGYVTKTKVLTKNKKSGKN